MSITLSIPATTGDPGTFRKMILIDPNDRQTPATAPIRETPKPSDVPMRPPDAPKRTSRPFATERPAPTALIPCAASTPARHPIHVLTTATPTAPSEQNALWKTPEHVEVGEVQAPATPKRAEHPSANLTDIDSAPKQARRRLFDDVPTHSGWEARRDDGGEWPSMADYGDDNAVDMVDAASADGNMAYPVDAVQAERCVAPEIPVRQRTKYNRLLDFLRTFESVPPISPSAYGELVTDRPIRGTSYVDVLRALFVNSRSQVAGLCEAISALRKAGASVGLLGSKRAIDLFNLGHTISQRGGSASLNKPAPPGRHQRVLRVFNPKYY